MLARRSYGRLVAVVAAAGILGLAAAGALPAVVGARAVDPGPAGTHELAQRARLIPFDPAPAITLPTTAGDLVVGGGTPGTESYILIGYSGLSTLSESLWAASAEELLANSPRDVHYVFMSYSDDAEQALTEVTEMRTKVDAAIAALGDAAEQAHWRAHVHYVTDNPLKIVGPLEGVLADWGALMARVHAEWTPAGAEPAQLDVEGNTDRGWARSLRDSGPITAPLARYGEPGTEQALACGQTDPLQDVTDRIALVERGTCNFADKVLNAERHGAKAVIIYTTADRARGHMAGVCETCPQIPVAHIDREPGLQMDAQLAADTAVTVTLSAGDLVPIELLAIDQQSRFRELGFIPFPFNEYLETPLDDLRLVGYEARYFHYEHQRDSRLAAEEAAGTVTEIPVIQGVWAADPEWKGVRTYVDVDLPDAQAMRQFDTLEVELRLSCPNHRHASCPAWDYIADLFLCDAADPSRCDTLFGRWITPYWSESHWVTDYSPLLAFLSDGGRRRFGFYTQQRYQVDLTLRLSNRGKGLVPKRAVDLGLNGGPFVSGYNSRFPPVMFEAPAWAEKAEVASFVTGHGFGHDAENCAEFCNHTHHIAVNRAAEHVKTHPLAGTEMGCAEQVPDGVVPNQGGTWIYGRGGWCPGLDVPPWVIDVTGDLLPSGENRLRYRGLFNGADYEPVPADPANPTDFDANIRMRSYLVYWARPEVDAGPAPTPYPLATPTVEPTTPVPTPPVPTTPVPTTPVPTTPVPTPPVPTIVPTGSPTTGPGPSPTTGPSPTGGPTVTATSGLPTPTGETRPSPTSWRPSYDPRVCRQLIDRVPDQVIAAALANPAAIPGYGRLCRPNLPASRWNPVRDLLSLYIPAKPFHPVYNGLVWSCGCP